MLGMKIGGKPHTLKLLGELGGVGHIREQQCADLGHGVMLRHGLAWSGSTNT